MGIWQRVRRLLGQVPAPPQPPAVSTAAATIAEEEPAVAEVSAATVIAALAQPGPPFLLDIREQYEWRQVRIPAAAHIPMNDVPARLGELPRDRRIVVVCAHGSRSYSVAGWLSEQGYPAASLAGGITQWTIHGGPVEQGAP